MIEGKKLTTILVLKVLEEYSDENTYLTQQQIIDKISDRYGVEFERKSIADSIRLLQELDYDIIKGSKGGFALISRLFEPSEATFLIDALFSSKVVNGKQARDLAEKISGTLSKSQRKTYNYLYKSDDINRTMNNTVFYNIEVIQEAIEKNVWIEFKYTTHNKDGELVERMNGYLYHASPCYLINNFGKYYFLGKRSNYDGAVVFRVDYMKDVKLFESRTRVDPRTIPDFAKYRSITEYINDHIYIFGGESITAIMEIKKNIDTRGNVTDPGVQYAKDWFGKNVFIYADGDKVMAKVKSNRKALYYWVMQYSESIHVISPDDFVEDIKKAAKNLVEEYK